MAGSRRLALRFGALFVAAAMAGGLAACGQNAAGTPGSTAQSDASRAVAFSACMRAHGITNFPDPTAGSGSGKGAHIAVVGIGGETFDLSAAGLDTRTTRFQSAMEGCSAGLGVQAVPPLGTTAEGRQAALAFSACMRSQGFAAFPDPTFGGGGSTDHETIVLPGVQFPLSGTGIDPHASEFQSALGACMVKLRGVLPNLPGSPPGG